MEGARRCQNAQRVDGHSGNVPFHQEPYLYRKKKHRKELKNIITWFIQSKKAKEVGLSLSIALSKHSINMYYMEGASGGRGEEIRRTLGVSERGRQKAERSTRHSATRGICPEKIITGRHDVVEPEAGAVPAEGLGKGSGLYREIFK